MITQDKESWKILKTLSLISILMMVFFYHQTVKAQSVQRPVLTLCGLCGCPCGCITSQTNKKSGNLQKKSDYAKRLRTGCLPLLWHTETTRMKEAFPWLQFYVTLQPNNKTQPLNPHTTESNEWRVDTRQRPYAPTYQQNTPTLLHFFQHKCI